MTVPIISIIVYAAWFALIFAGSKRAKRGSFNQDCMSLEATKNLQGLAALGVVCHHLSQPAPNSAPMAALGQMQLFRDIGFLFVALFFFVSGYGLVKSLDAKPHYLKGFVRRRILPVAVCFYAMNLFYVAWHLLLGTQMSASEWICKILGVALLNDNAWFVPVIVIMYFVFCFAFSGERGSKNRLLAFAIVFIAIALQWGLFLFNKHFPWWWGERGWWKAPGALFACPWYKRPLALWFEGEWWVNSTIAFFAGMLAAQFEKNIFAFFCRAWAVKFAAAVLLLAASFALRFYLFSRNIHYWLEFSGDNSTRPRALMLCAENLQVLAWLLAFYLARMKRWSKNRVLEFWGNHSLEFYLMQAIPLRTFAILFGWTDKSFQAVEHFQLEGYKGQLKALLYLLLVLAATMLLGIALKFMCNKILRRPPSSAQSAGSGKKGERP